MSQSERPIVAAPLAPEHENPIPRASPSRPAPAPPGLVAEKAVLPAKKKAERSLTVAFDDATWEQLDVLAEATTLPKAGVVRRAIRLLSWINKQLDGGYKVALIKDGESPLLVELL